MSRGARATLGVIAGIFYAVMMIGVLRAVRYHWLPWLVGTNRDDYVVIAFYQPGWPSWIHALTIGGWTATSFLACIVGGLFLRAAGRTISYAVGGILGAAFLFVFTIADYPFWMTAAGVAGIAVMTLYAARLMQWPRGPEKSLA